MPRQLPKPRGQAPEPETPAPTPRPRRNRRESPYALQREELREREAARAKASRDGKTHKRFSDTEYREGEYDDGGTGVPWVHPDNPALWEGSICEDV